MNDTTTAEAVDATPPLLRRGVRARDVAESMGVSEAELLATHHGPEVVHVAPDFRAILPLLPTLGEVMSLTRNEAAVHEKIGTFGNITLGQAHGLVLNGAIDQRLFLSHWRFAFAVELPGEDGPRRSLQIFDRFGDAVIKIHLKPQSDVAAFEALRDRFLAEPEPLDIEAPAPSPAAQASVDAAAFRADFVRMQDIHEFFPLLRRHDVSRRGAIDLLDESHVRRLPADTAQPLLETAAASGLPIMCFVGSRGCVQIHSGPVETIKVIGPWLNILDPGFNLHLRQDLVAEAWEVRKPTRHGDITSVELYDRNGGLLVQFFGVREPGKPENPAWRDLVARLGHDMQ